MRRNPTATPAAQPVAPPIPPQAGLPATVPRTSGLLLDFARGFTGERVRLRDLRQQLGTRSFGFLLLLFALPNAIPIVIPGLATLTGILLAFIALQMMLGLPTLYLPRWLDERSIARDDFRRLVTRSLPWLQRVERFLKPRYSRLTSGRSERMIGAVCLVLALVLALPVPFGNLLPGIGLALLALGVLERDGISVGLGAIVGLGGVLFASGTVWGMAKGAAYLVQTALG